MFFFPFVLVCIASGLIDTFTTRLLDSHEEYGFLVAGVALALALAHRPTRWADLLFGVIVLTAAAWVDVALSDVFALIAPTAITIPASLAAGFCCLLFCVWWIPDEYGFNLLVISLGFDAWPDKERPAIYPVVHQMVFFVASAFFEVGIDDIMQNTHWTWSLAAGFVCTIVITYTLNLALVPVLLYTITCSGLDVGYSAVLWKMSRGHVWAQFFLGLTGGFTILLALFGLGYLLEPRRYKWKWVDSVVTTTADRRSNSNRFVY